MGSNDFQTILALGAVGIGGYLFLTEIFPMIKRNLNEALGELEGPQEEEQVPITLVEDRYPDVVVEDRYPDIVYNPPPIINVRGPPVPVIPCPLGKYWDGFRCKKVDCPPGTKLDQDIGVCEPECPRGYYFKASAGRCVLLDKPCDRGEYWDGRRCRDIPRNPAERRRIERRFGSGNFTRDRWHRDRDAEEKVKAAITGKLPTEVKPETKRLEEIVEKAITSFIDVEYF